MGDRLKLTILQLGAFSFPLHQGSQVYLRGMAEALARRGHRVIVACYHHGVEAELPGVEIIRAAPVPGGTVARSGPHWSKPVQNVLLARTVRRILRTHEPNIIHAHNVEAPLVARLASPRGSGVPVIYNAHTRMEEELGTYFPGWLARPAALFGRTIDASMPWVSQASLAISQNGREHLGGRWGEATAAIPPGVNLAELSGGDAKRARLAWDLGTRPWVVYAGNADAYQDLPVLFAAVARKPLLGLLVITGSSGDTVRALASAAGLDSERFRLVISTRFRDTLDALCAATVSGLPRQKCAGFPIKLLNQLALGVPTVAAQGSAAKIPGVIPVANGDASAMGDALERVALDANWRQKLAAEAMKAIRSEWTWDARAVELERFYERVLAT